MKNTFTFCLLMFCAIQAYSQQLRWIAKQGGTGTDQTNGVATDAQGNVISTGKFDGTASFGSLMLTTSGSLDIFVAKYDSTGNCLWARKAGGSFGDEALAVATDADDNIYITGNIGQAGAVFDGIVVGSAGVHTGFVAKYKSDGTIVWVRTMGGANASAYPLKIATYEDKVYVAGDFYGNISFGGSQPLSSAAGGMNDVFVTQYDSAGTAQWANRGGDRKEEKLTGLTVDLSGNVLIYGSYDSLTTFLGNTVYAEYLGDFFGHTDLFLVKYSSSGGSVWFRSIGGDDTEEGGGICTDTDGNIYTTGFFRVSFKAGAITANNSGTTNTLFLYKCNASGTASWVKYSPYPNSLGFQKGLSLARSGNEIFLAGYFGNKYKANNNNLTATGENNPLLLKFDTSGTIAWGMFGNAQSGRVSQALSVAVSNSRIYYAGYIVGTMTFDGETVTGNGAYVDGFICSVINNNTPVNNVTDPTSLNVSNATTSSLTLNWTGSSSEFRVLKKTGMSSASPTDGDVVYEGSNLSVTLSALTANTAYFFTVYGKASGSAVYSTGNKKIAATTVSNNPDESVVTGFLAGETGSHTFGGTGVRINITGASLSDGNIRVEVNTNLTSTGTLPVNIDSIFEAVYWTVTNTGLTGGSLRYCITLDVSDAADLVDFANYHILKRPDAGAAWEDLMSNPSYTVTFNSPEITICGLSTFSEFVVAQSSSPTSLHESSVDHISVYPNPASDVVYIRSQQHVPVIALYDMQGRMIRSAGMIKGNETAINLEGIPAGLYMIQAGNSRKKIIVMD